MHLKIDQTFVRDATSDTDDAALVMAIITLAHNLRLKVIAEGVETEDQLRFLQLLRCDEIQGYSLQQTPARGNARVVIRFSRGDEFLKDLDHGSALSVLGSVSGDTQNAQRLTRQGSRHRRHSTKSQSRAADFGSLTNVPLREF